MVHLNYMDQLTNRFTDNGFNLIRNVKISDINFSCIASKKLYYGLVFAYHHHCYLYRNLDRNPIPLSKILSVNQMARYHTNNVFHKLSKFLRLRVPITTTVIISEQGFESETIKFIERIKQTPQMGDVNTIILLDPIKNEIYHLMRYGFVASLPMPRADEDAEKLLL